MISWLSEGENTLEDGSGILDGDAKEEVLGRTLGIWQGEWNGEISGRLGLKE
ncbi:hypothetical protein [Paenibacillus thiaminolyticus]|uniref:hypothetical protein n=1 Tax=Paenibacillus thiaminolyticus TaxID=49283 RepID=UPI000E082C5E|nr:hypothetical protein [Paenibacillus thiaminolyticus]MEC0103940.1 hypothetical protein [Paenibacillus thiaminolyticus]CAH8709469.1 hypothetical protein KYE0_001886 [Paenibacillus thiaminolyticus]SUA95124.1 Uncharacterised protein [Paenibacillus thiaminolyticus]